MCRASPADGLSETDCLFLLDHFFMANPDQMILPYPRYAELFHRRGAGQNTATRGPAPLQRARLPRPAGLVQPGLDPSAGHRAGRTAARVCAGRAAITAKTTRTACSTSNSKSSRRILPLHRQLAERGQVELTTTPYYHPILPLLFDKTAGARGHAGRAAAALHAAAIPRTRPCTFAGPSSSTRRLFGRAPRGMWPAEGSVCQAMMPLLARTRHRWIATDEEILAASTQGYVGRDEQGTRRQSRPALPAVQGPRGRRRAGDRLPRPCAAATMIGFHYQRSDGPVGRRPLPRLPARHQPGDSRHGAGTRHASSSTAKTAGSTIPTAASIVPALALPALQLRDPGVHPCRIGELPGEHPPHDTLPHLLAGSWISHNFAIWIGHEEDNTAWDLLHRTREHLVEKSQDGGWRLDDGARTSHAQHESRNGTAAGRRRACAVPARVCCTASASPSHGPGRRSYIAEGSDWFWWYGDDHSSAQDALFDYLFRKHLRNVYVLLGDEPPAELGRAIKRAARQEMYIQRRASFLDVKIDGRFTFFEWIRAGRYTCQNERGTMAWPARRAQGAVLRLRPRSALLAHRLRRPGTAWS